MRMKTATFLAAAALGVASLAATPAMADEPNRAAKAIPSCEMWAMADRVDGQGKMYGAGGIYDCGRVAQLRILLYRDSALVADATVTDCNTPCAGSTGYVSIPSGSHTWCTIARAITAGGDKATSACTVTPSRVRRTRTP